MERSPEVRIIEVPHVRGALYHHGQGPGGACPPAPKPSHFSRRKVVGSDDLHAGPVPPSTIDVDNRDRTGGRSRGRGWGNSLLDRVATVAIGGTRRGPTGP